MMSKNRCILAMFCVSLLMVACSSKAKKTREVQEALERMNEEHKAQTLKNKVEADRISSPRADGIAARVNEEVILLSDLEQVAPELFREIRTQSPGSEAPTQLREARRAVLERLIERKLLEQEAEKQEIEVTKEEVDAAVDRLIRQAGVSKEEFYVELARKRTSIEEYKENVRRELKVYKLLDREINRHIHITDEQCRQHYNAHKDEYVNPGGGVHIQQIVLLVRGGREKEVEQKREQINEMRKRIMDGEDFGRLAREYSEGPNAERGGDCGFFKEGELMPELDQQVSNLKEGEVSPVIETSVGFHLLKVVDKGTGEGRTLDSVREDIRSELGNETYQKELNKLLESLKESAYIDVRL